MRKRFRKITISIEEYVARWIRSEAARTGISVSRFLEEILKDRMIRQDNYEAARRSALARKPFLKSDGCYLTRDEAHERSR